VLSSGDIEAILGYRKKPFGRLIEEFLGMTHFDTLWTIAVSTDNYIIPA
jgi:hypothetical protein